jgi:hypothetical protein
MLFAFILMKGEHKKINRYFNSILYEKSKKELSKIMSKKMKNTVTCKSLSNPKIKYFRVSKEEFDNNDDLVGVSHNKKVSEATKEKMRGTRECIKGKNNPRSKTPYSEETKKKLSIIRKNKNIIEIMGPVKAYISKIKRKKSIKKIKFPKRSEKAKEKTRITLKNKPLKKCEYCEYETNNYGALKVHSVNCKNNPNAIENKKILKNKTKKLECPYCNKICTISNAKGYHFEKFKYSYSNAEEIDKLIFSKPFWLGV